MIFKRPEFICACDGRSCHNMKRSSTDIAWKMWEITFGVDPKIVDQIFYVKKESVVVQKNSFHFCEKHRNYYKELILGLIAIEFPDNIEKISTAADFKEYLGCWITIIDVLGGHPIQNFQLPYPTFEKIYRKFCSALIKFPIIDSKIEKLKNTFDCFK